MVEIQLILSRIVQTWPVTISSSWGNSLPQSAPNQVGALTSRCHCSKGQALWGCLHSHFSHCLVAQNWLFTVWTRLQPLSPTLSVKQLLLSQFVLTGVRIFQQVCQSQHLSKTWWPLSPPHTRTEFPKRTALWPCLRRNIFVDTINIFEITWIQGGQVMCKHDWVRQPEHKTWWLTFPFGPIIMAWNTSWQIW